MSTKTLLKHARSLQQKKFRDLHAAFLVQGPKLVQELLRSTWSIDSMIATAAAAERYTLPGAVIVPDHELDRIGTLDSGNEVVAVVLKAPASPIQDLGPDELVLALDGITDPGNLGTVVRIADWFGTARVWCSYGSVDLYNPKCVQASMGAIFRVRVDQVDLPVLLEQQRSKGAALYTATMEGRSVFEVDVKGKAVLVLGSESHGLSADVRALASTSIGIPGGGGAESLNVAMAASALCMEFARQRRMA
ncbi:MAG: RNA methyltransferase [Flavobacteriales bacterium]|nr:RNA methyltransferase [Flavobacteriales bacterium]